MPGASIEALSDCGPGKEKLGRIAPGPSSRGAGIGLERIRERVSGCGRAEDGLNRAGDPDPARPKQYMIPRDGQIKKSLKLTLDPMFLSFKNYLSTTRHNRDACRTRLEDNPEWRLAGYSLC